jgi:hypothetical protein
MQQSINCLNVHNPIKLEGEVTLSLGPSFDPFNPKFTIASQKVSEISYCLMKLGISSQDL